MKNITLLALILCLGTIAKSQIPKSVDSLAIYLKTKPVDSTYILALSNYTHAIIQTGNFKKADSLIKKINELTIRLNFPAGHYKANYLMAFIDYNKQNYKQLLIRSLNSFKIIKMYNLPKSYYQNSLNSLAITYNALGDQKKSVQYSMELVEYQEKHKLKPYLGLPYLMLAENQIRYKKNNEAIAYYKKFNELELQSGNTVNLAASEIGLGKVYMLLGKNNEAIQHLNTSLAYSKKTNCVVQQSESQLYLGKVYTQMGKYDLAEKNFKISENIISKTTSLISKIKILSGLGDLYFLKDKPVLAEKYLLEAHTLCKNIDNPEHIYGVNLALANLYFQQKQYKKAFIHKEQSEIYRDSLFKQETIANTENLIQQYESEKKEQEIALLNAKNKKNSIQTKAIIGGSLLLFLLACISIVLVINHGKLKQLKESQKLRVKIAADLHDEVGSTLSSIMLISDMAQKQIGTSQKMFSKINADSKSVIESVDDIIWSINPVNDSLKGICIRLREFALPLTESKNIALDFNISAGFEKIQVPMVVGRNLYLIVKEAINNLVKYAETKKARVELHVEQQTISAIIEDFGKGFDTETQSNRNGIKNMQARALEAGGKLKITSVPSKGTLILLKIPMA
jgi:two-component system, NarL family, sensor histidine kinase UhpB